MPDRNTLPASKESRITNKKCVPRLLRTFGFFLLALELAYVIGLFGCGPNGCSSGQTPPSGYSCGSLSGGAGNCWAAVTTCCGAPPPQGFFPPSILGYVTSIYVNQQINAGDGSIANALQLKASNTSSYIMAGYENLASAAVLQGCSAAGFWYFLEQIDNNGFAHQCLVTVPQADFGQYAVVAIKGTGSSLPNTSTFFVSITTQTTNQSMTVTNALWPSGGPQFASVQFGQRLIGSQGASSTSMIFYNNAWQDQNGQMHFQSYDGAIIGDNPPFGNWVTPPSQSTAGDGGDFFAECCLAPNTVYPVTIVFPTTTTGSTSAPMTVLVTNNISSNGPLNITGITITGTNASDFKIATNGCGNSLAPLASCSITLTFTPSAQGARSATLTVSDNGGSGTGTDSVTLTGTGG